MQGSMLKIHEKMDTKNPQEREWLAQEHREIIYQYLQIMKDGIMMGGDGKTGSGCCDG